MEYIRAIVYKGKEGLPNLVIQLEHYLIAFLDFRRSQKEHSKSNLLLRACRFYLESDFIMTGLKALSNFTHQVTMRFLNCVERVDQNALCLIIPNLLQKLQNGNLTCDDLLLINIQSSFCVSQQQVDQKCSVLGKTGQIKKEVQAQYK